MLHLDWVAGYLKNKGFEVEEERGEFTGEQMVTATFQTKNGEMAVYAIAGGARIGKPNGSHKYYYEISDAKLARYVQQVIENNGGAK